MGIVSLEFQGIRDQRLLVTLLVLISLTLVAAGIWQLICRRWRYGLACLVAGLTPSLFIPLLLGDALIRYTQGERKRAATTLLAAGVLAAGSILAGLFVLTSRDTMGALWMSLLGVEVAMAVGVFYTTVYSHLGTRRMATLMVMRCLAILALLMVLFKPALSFTPEVEEFKACLPILVDRSGSMGTADEPNAPDRYRQAIQMLLTQQGRIDRNFRPRWYHFGEEMQSAVNLEDLGKLQPTGPGTEGTNVAAAIRGAMAKEAPGQLPGVLVVSDGIHNASENILDAAIEAGAPIFTIGVGGESETLSGRKNIQLVSLDAPLEAVKNNVATLSAEVKISGFAASPGDIQLMEEGSDQPIATERLWTDKNVATVTAKLKWTPKDAASAPASGPDGKDASRSRATVRRLRVSIPPNPAETVNEDNAAEIHILVTEPRVRVFYVEGSMRPEYRFLKRLLDTDPNVQFMSLVRVTGNRFWAQGNVAGRQLTALPMTADDFKLMDVVIFGDLDRSFLTVSQMKGFREFVNNGGGVVMIGGQNCFGPGGYSATDIEQVLPVTVGTRTQPQETTPFLPQVTAEGEQHPIFEGIGDYFPGPGKRPPKAGLPKLPELRGCVTVVGAKSGASVLALHPTRTNESGPLIALAVQRFGAGRSAAFTSDTTWQWYLPLQGMGSESPYQRFWGQLIRWLANVQTKAKDSQPSVVMRLDRSYLQVGQTLKVLSRVQDERGKTVETAQATCTITSVDRKTDPETVPLSLRRGSGLFEAAYRPRREGEYLMKVTATDSAGKELGSDQLTLRVAPHSAEMDRLARDRKVLGEIAERTQGRYSDISGLPDVIEQLIERQKTLAGPAPKTETYNLAFGLPHPWDFTVLFLIFVVLLTFEWTMRRGWQLH